MAANQFTQENLYPALAASCTQQGMADLATGQSDNKDWL